MNFTLITATLDISAIVLFSLFQRVHQVSLGRRLAVRKPEALMTKFAKESSLFRSEYVIFFDFGKCMYLLILTIAKFSVSLWKNCYYPRFRYV